MRGMCLLVQFAQIQVAKFQIFLQCSIIFICIDGDQVGSCQSAFVSSLGNGLFQRFQEAFVINGAFLQIQENVSASAAEIADKKPCIVDIHNQLMQCHQTGGADQIFFLSSKIQTIFIQSADIHDQSIGIIVDHDGGIYAEDDSACFFYWLDAAICCIAAGGHGQGHYNQKDICQKFFSHKIRTLLSRI